MAERLTLTVSPPLPLVNHHCGRTHDTTRHDTTCHPLQTLALVLVLLKLPGFCIYWWHSLRSNPPLNHVNPDGAGGFDDYDGAVDVEAAAGGAAGAGGEARGSGSSRVHPASAAERYAA